MKRVKTKNPNKNAASAKNLWLSKDAQNMAGELKKKMHRPSISNVVEVLILEKAAELGIA